MGEFTHGARLVYIATGGLNPPNGNWEVIGI